MLKTRVPLGLVLLLALILSACNITDPPAEDVDPEPVSVTVAGYEGPESTVTVRMYDSNYYEHELTDFASITADGVLTFEYPTPDSALLYPITVTDEFWCVDPDTGESMECEIERFPSDSYDNPDALLGAAEFLTVADLGTIYPGTLDQEPSVGARFGIHLYSSEAVTISIDESMSDHPNYDGEMHLPLTAGWNFVITEVTELDSEGYPSEFKQYVGSESDIDWSWSARPTPVSLEITPDSSQVPAQSSLYLNLVVVMSDDMAHWPESSDATWSSDDDSTATVDSEGQVTGVAGGSTTITANYEGLTATATIDVIPALD